MEQRVDLYKAELLSMTAGRVADAPALIFTMRPDSRSFQSYNFAFTPSQATRIHDELSRLLFNDPESWLHVPAEQRQRTDEP